MAPQTLATGHIPTQLQTTPDDQTRAMERWALVEAAQLGDAESYGQLYEAVLDNVWRYVYFRVGNRQLAEDIVSVVFLRGWQRIGTVTWQGKDILAWLLTIARNAIADYRKSPVSREIFAGGWEGPERPDPRPSPDVATESYLFNRQLWAAVQALPSKDQRDVIVYRYGHGLNIEETAAAMGKNQGAVKALAYRATAQLRRTLQDRGLIG